MGNSVIIELKRKNSPLGVETQALQYLADFSKFKGQAFIKRFLADNPGLEENIYGFLGDEVKTEDINKNSRIILLARSFDPTLFSMGEWLSSRGIAFRCIEYMFGLFTDKAGVCIIKFRCRALPILGSAVLQELSMGQKLLDERQIKESVKQALVELLRERKDLLYEFIAEIVEDYALARAIKEGEQTPKVSREKVLRTCA